MTKKCPEGHLDLVAQDDLVLSFSATLFKIIDYNQETALACCIH